MKDISEKLLHELKGAVFCKEAIFENALAGCLFDALKNPCIGVYGVSVCMEYRCVWRNSELSFEIKRRVLVQIK